MRMSITKELDCGFIISHELFINNIYKTVIENNTTYQYSVKHSYFNIDKPFKTKMTKKEDVSSTSFSDEANFIQKTYFMLTDSLKCDTDPLHCDVGDPKKAADKFYLESNARKFDTTCGGNTGKESVVAQIEGEKYLIPNECLFFNADVRQIDQYLNKKFDAIVLDPPWWNKYIRRKRNHNAEDGYTMMWNSDLAKVPVNNLLEEDGLVCVWCTNSPSNIKDLIDNVFPQWGLVHIGHWFWLKVTKEGKPVTPFSTGNGKQPFERIIFGCREKRNLPVPESNKLIISVPSSIHSHKPPLAEILQRYIPENAKCLEIFARYLLPNWTSFGNEVLKLQHVSLFHNKTEASA